MHDDRSEAGSETKVDELSAAELVSELIPESVPELASQSDEALANQPLTPSPLSQSLPDTDQSFGLTITLADYQALLDELTLAQERDRQALNRIQNLEQALDDALLCIDEIRQQLRDQKFLENQLASTEEYSYVQQQAIARLKLQIADQQDSLEAKAVETQQRDQAVEELLAIIEVLTQGQQEKLEEIRLQLAQDQRDVQTHRSRLEKQVEDLQVLLESRQQRVSALESETLAARTMSASLRGQLEIAQAQIRNLSGSLRQRQSNLANLEKQLEKAQITLENQAHPFARLRRDRPNDSAVNATLQKLQQELAQSQSQVQQLEEHLTQESLQVTRWQQNYYDLEQERDRHLTRMMELERQAADMQEQILHQAQQSTEQETAVQYWKDRHQTLRNHLIYLRDRLEQSLTSPAHGIDPEADYHLFSDLLHHLDQGLTGEKSEALALPSQPPLPKLGSLRLPDFLVRRRDAKD